jgi:hypothetical protein
VRHFEARNSLRLALLAALGYGVIGCSSDTDHGPPVGAPNVPVVITEGGGSGGTVNGQGAAPNGGDTSNLGTAGRLDGLGGTGGSGFADPNAGSPGFGSPGTAGGTNEPPFSAGGGPSSSGGGF